MNINIDNIDALIEIVDHCIVNDIKINVTYGREARLSANSERLLDQLKNPKMQDTTVGGLRDFLRNTDFLSE